MEGRHNNNDSGRSSYGRQQNNRNGGHRRHERFEGPKREAILKLQNYLNQEIIVNLSGGREVEGKLTGFDQLMNLVLEDTVEKLRDVNDRTKFTGSTRKLGKIIIRGPLLLAISPKDGFETISNPFVSDSSQEKVL